ncbi:hypothetical protein EBT31_15940 [bacterium]|jgi:hypothetical protein|nr:hypothetical protein [bacterium]
MSLTARSTAHLRDLGYMVATVEHYNSFTKRKHDLWGCIDLLAIGNGETVAVQVTSKSNLSARRHKIEEAEAYPEMIRSGWRIVLHGWWKEKNRWQLKEVEL